MRAGVWWYVIDPSLAPLSLTSAAGGCCPVGSSCDRGGKCIPAPGVSYSHECGASSYLCPESLGYGCCGDGLACGKDRCYSTDASTIVFTRTITTTEDDDEITTTETVTSVSTPDAEGTATEAPDEPALQKFYPTAVPKVEPLITEDSDGGGLTSGQIGGVVAGSIIFLIIVIVAAFFIIRRLNHVAKVVEESKSSEPEDKPDAAAAAHYSKHGDAETSSLGTRTTTASPRSRFRSGTTDSDSEVPTLFGSPSPNTPGSEIGSRRESHRSTSSDGMVTVSSLRGDSIRTTPEGFVMPVSPEPAELEAETVRAELSGDASPIPELPSPIPGSTRLSRGKDGSHRRTPSAAAPALDVVDEDGEYHGYYGPLDKVVGQTSAAASGPAGTPEEKPLREES